MPRRMLPALLESTLQAGAEARFEVAGRSMLPLIRPGDVLRVRRPAEDEPGIGDVVAVRGAPGGEVLVHRVVRLSRDRFMIRGDNTTVANGEYARGDILGVVAAVERNGRHARFGAGRWGWVVALAVRTGAINWYNRACLKFLTLISGLRQHKGDDGNE
jgi:signal peptidase I